MNKYIYSIIFVFQIFVFPAIAGNSLLPEDYPNADTSLVEVQFVEDEFFQSYRSDSEFDYEGEFAQAERNTPGKRFFQFLLELLHDFNHLLKVIPVLVQIVLWGLVLFCLIVVISKTKLIRLFYSSSEISQPDFQIHDEEESISDFESAIRQELSKLQYRKAVRLLYLKILKSLDQIELIYYAKGKTNIDYLGELRGTNLQTGFLRLTGIYNNVWYGHFEIEEKQYHQYEQIFAQFLGQLDVKK